MLNFPSAQNEKENVRKMHSTYTNKPKPDLQIISQGSHFEDGTRASLAFRAQPNPESVPAVPTTWDTVYDPDHPNADWSGLVSKDALFTKKYIRDHPSLRENVQRTEHGIISRDERQEFSKRRNNNDGIAEKNAGSVVIGGIDRPDDRWKTTYRRFESKEQTDREQLTIEKRTNPMKRIPDPAQARGRSDTQSLTPQQELMYRSLKDESYSSRDSAPKFNPRTSLLSNLGDSLLSTVEPPPSTTKAAYNSESYRSMITDNYNPLPGWYVVALFLLLFHLLSFLFVQDILVAVDKDKSTL